MTMTTLIAVALIQWTSSILSLDKTAAQVGANCRVKGEVTFVGDGGFVMESARHGPARGVFVVAPSNTVSVGDNVIVQGRTDWWGENVIRSSLVMLDREKVELESPRPVKLWDIFSGRCGNRRVRLQGPVVAIGPDGRTFTLHADERHCVPIVLTGMRPDGDIGPYQGLVGAVVPNGPLKIGEEVAVAGVVRNVYDREGHFLSAHVGARPEDIVVDLAARAWRRALAIAAYVTGVALVAAVVVFLVLWLRAVRAKREMALLAAERTRLADELHDTVEQYLAGARIFLAGAVRTPELPDRATKAIQAATNVLDEAKVNVGKAIDALRTRGGAQ